jgi:PRTRC genetic system protein E
MNDFFSKLQEVLLQCDESIDFYLKRDGTGLSVTVVPHLQKPMTVEVPSHIDQARAALAIPLYMRGSGEELDTAFWQRLREYTGERSALHDTVELALTELSEANKSVRSKMRSKNASKVTGQPADAQSVSKTHGDNEPELTKDDDEQLTETGTKSATSDDMSQPLSLF